MLTREPLNVGAVCHTPSCALGQLFLFTLPVSFRLSLRTSMINVSFVILHYRIAMGARMELGFYFLFFLNLPSSIRILFVFCKAQMME